MRLSIIIPSHHRADLLHACLASITRHRPVGTEVIVVDDGSARGVVAATADTWPHVDIVRLPRQVGFCAAVNAGLRRATGAVVQVLNDDAEVTAGWAEPAWERLADPAIGAVAPLVLSWPTGEIIDSAGDHYYLGGVARKRGHGRPLCSQTLQAGPVFGACGCGAFYRRSALEHIGGFPEDFTAYFDDVDVAFRLRWAGWQVWFEPRSRLLHHGAASHGRRPDDRLLAQQSRNEERVFWRHVPLRLWPRAVPQHLAVLVGKAWQRWREGRLGPFLAGRWAAWREVPAAWSEQYRRATPADAGAWSCLDPTWPGASAPQSEPVT
ncbi:MAG TPA: glycosyltransferase family 2 protein [Gemmatales bacterium]|nr:glycosyltransferase family 2 protein [Gemmatales bacterium]